MRIRASSNQLFSISGYRQSRPIKRRDSCHQNALYLAMYQGRSIYSVLRTLPETFVFEQQIVVIQQ
jgi:hypothetical protein